MHIDDLRTLAPFWLHKNEEVRADRAHWATEITGDIYGQGWISEMYGYSFGAAQVCKLVLKSVDVKNILLHYGLSFTVGNWSFDKAEHHDDDIVYDCNRLFPPPPYPKEVRHPNKKSLKSFIL